MKENRFALIKNLTFHLHVEFHYHEHRNYEIDTSASVYARFRPLRLFPFLQTDQKAMKVTPFTKIADLKVDKSLKSLN